MSYRITPTVALDELTPETDARGNTLAVGDLVRSFDFATMGLLGDGTIGRTEQMGELASYIVGEIEAIGEDIQEGCPRYRIKPVHRMYVGEANEFFAQDTAQRFYPPVNGTPSLFGDHCAGVFKIERRKA